MPSFAILFAFLAKKKHMDTHSRCNYRFFELFLKRHIFHVMLFSCQFVIL